MPSEKQKNSLYLPRKKFFFKMYDWQQFDLDKKVPVPKYSCKIAKKPYTYCIDADFGTLNLFGKMLAFFYKQERIVEFLLEMEHKDFSYLHYERETEEEIMKESYETNEPIDCDKYTMLAWKHNDYIRFQIWKHNKPTQKGKKQLSLYLDKKANVSEFFKEIKAKKLYKCTTKYKNSIPHPMADIRIKNLPNFEFKEYDNADFYIDLSKNIEDIEMPNCDCKFVENFQISIRKYNYSQTATYIIEFFDYLKIHNLTEKHHINIANFLYKLKNKPFSFCELIQGNGEYLLLAWNLNDTIRFLIFECRIKPNFCVCKIDSQIKSEKFFKEFEKIVELKNS